MSDQAISNKNDQLILISISKTTQIRLEFINTYKNHKNLNETIDYVLDVFDFFNNEDNLILDEEEKN